MADPQNYSARVDYRKPDAWYRRLNRLGIAFTSLGLAPRDAVTLSVACRKSGGRQRIPILKTTFAGDDYLVSLAGESQWVRNVRAASGAVTITRRGRRHALLEEVADAARSPILFAYLYAARERSSANSYAKQAEFYFGLSPDAGEAELAEVAEFYPVFRIRYR